MEIAIMSIFKQGDLISINETSKFTRKRKKLNLKQTEEMNIVIETEEINKSRRKVKEN